MSSLILCFAPIISYYVIFTVCARMHALCHIIYLLLYLFYRSAPNLLDSYLNSAMLALRPETGQKLNEREERRTMKNGKRILNVKVSRILEQGADSSYLDQDIEGFAERKRQFEAGQFDFIGIKAEAEIGLSNTGRNLPHYIVQKITSGGLWGIESDSDAAYLKEIESEQLAELKTELTALGFSKRAIAKAFQNIERTV